MTDINTLNSDIGGMPMDIHHTFIPEMTLNDLTRNPECPHLKKLAASSGLVISEDVMNGNEPKETDVYKEMLPKKRKRHPSDLSQQTNEADSFPLTPALSLEPVREDEIPPPLVEYAPQQNEDTPLQNETDATSDADSHTTDDLPRGVIHIRPIYRSTLPSMDPESSNSSKNDKNAHVERYVKEICILFFITSQSLYLQEIA
jgi:hypothetical protein